MSDVVLVEHHDHIMQITLNRPEARNAINGDVTQALGQALEAAEADTDVRAIVLAGNGPVFCAGADLRAISKGESLNPPGTEAWGFAGMVTHPISVPIIAAVDGQALGGGTELVLSCDLVVAAQSAKFGLPEVKRGLMAAAGGAFRLVQQIPHKVAMGMLLTGEPITAEEAATWGLVNQVVADGTAVEAALELAAQIAQNAPLAVRASKRVALGIRDGVVADEVDAWQANNHEMMAVMTSADAMEGTIAFTEKRAPVWQGK